MELDVEHCGDVVVLALQLEELDASNSGELKRAAAPLLEAHSKLVLDLGKLRFIDSSGLGAFLSCLRTVNAKGGDLKLCALSKNVRSAFELVRMHRIFDVYDTREQAVRAFAAPSTNGNPHAT